MSYFIYHIPGYKIGVTRNPEKRIEKMQGYTKNQYEILEVHTCIDEVSKREIELQKQFNYRVDPKPYKKLFQPMDISSTEKTTTFPVGRRKLKKWLSQNIGAEWETPQGYKFKLTKDNVDWIYSNSHKSQYKDNCCYIYNEPFYQQKRINATELEVFSNIRQWAEERGIYDKGDAKTQTLKLYEEAGELSQAILKKQKTEAVDAIGDCVVVLTNLAHLMGVSIEYCIDHAYNEIKDRKGSMQGGTFVKEQL